MLPKKSSSVAKLSDKEITLWAAYESTHSIEARNALAEFYRRRIEKLVHHFLSRRELSVTADEVMGTVWDRILCVAIPRYNHRLEVKFTTFAVPHIRGAILDAMRENDWVSRSARKQQAAVKQAIESLTHQNGQPPSDVQIARQLRIPVAELREILAVIEPVSVVSLNDGISQLPEISERLADPRALTPPQILQQKSLLDRLFRSCDDIEKAIIEGLYYRGQSMKVISVCIGLSESRINQIHARVIDRLRIDMAGRQDEFVV